LSFKSKLSVFITILVAAILILNISISYVTSRDDLIRQAEQKMQNIAEQIGMSIESSQQSSKILEDSLGSQLRLAAIAALRMLDSNIAIITSDQLVEVSRKVGVSDISLWQRFGNDIIIKQSSNEKELGINSKTFDYWHVAFHELFDLKPVSVSQGQVLANYWSGPINFATSDPRKINKWGYYYDGSTNYMINTIMDSEDFLALTDSIGTNSVIDTIMDTQPDILEVSSIDPEFFGESPIIKWKQGIPIYNLDVRAVNYGSYTYKDQKNDNFYVQKAITENKFVSFNSVIDGKHVIKSFIPIQVGKPYVIAVVFDEDYISRPLRDELVLNAIIAVCLLLIITASSYLIAGFMTRSLKQIVDKVNKIAAGDFNTTISIKTKDELGLLAASVNAMGNNLLEYTTKLKDSAEELRSTKEYLESIVGQTTDAIHITNLQGHVTDANRAFEAMFGWSTDEIEGKQLTNIPEEYKAEYEKQEALVKDGGSVSGFEMVRSTRSGELIDLSITISPIRDEKGQVIAIASISRNITSRKHSEELIRRTEKLSVVGQLAAGVAHEVRNPLTTLRGFVQLNKKKGSISPEHLDVMLRELDHINMIVSEFLVFAKPQADITKAVQLGDVLNDTIILIDSEAKLNAVKIELQSEGDIPSVNGEANQLKQVFVNILKNGIEAMDKGGNITIELMSGPNHTVILRFIDQGIGISESDLQRLGEPFFTRKTSGTGLGLMVSQTIIANHKGTIVFRSELGKGTCVEITLPQS